MRPLTCKRGAQAAPHANVPVAASAAEYADGEFTVAVAGTYEMSGAATHGYGHGISNRLTGASTVSCLGNQE
jgi:hypothetical protein